MSRVVLHIGIPKTGTTALQSFLISNRSKLLAQDISFPLFSSQDFVLPGRNGVFLTDYCRSQLEANKRPHSVQADRNIELLKQSIAEHTLTLLSDEGFWDHCGAVENSEVKQQTARFWMLCGETLRSCGVKDITVVVYLRNQVDWISSLWKQNVKVGRTSEPIAGYTQNPHVAFGADYLVHLSIIEETLKPSALVVRRYEASSFTGGTLIHDYCASTGISPEGLDISVNTDNPSISFDVAQALLPLYERYPENSYMRSRVIVPLSLSLSDTYPDAPGSMPFSQVDAMALLETYAQGNAEISKRYLDGAELFADALANRTQWIPDPKLTSSITQRFEQTCSKSIDLQFLKDSPLWPVIRKLRQHLRSSRLLH